MKTCYFLDLRWQEEILLSSYTFSMLFQLHYLFEDIPGQHVCVHIGAQKANKQDMEHAMQAIDIIHKQQAHIIVLLIESVKT